MYSSVNEHLLHSGCLFQGLAGVVKARSPEKGGPARQGLGREKWPGQRWWASLWRSAHGRMELSPAKCIGRGRWEQLFVCFLEIRSTVRCQHAPLTRGHLEPYGAGDCVARASCARSVACVPLSAALPNHMLLDTSPQEVEGPSPQRCVRACL